jgi:hypothetical protein
MNKKGKIIPHAERRFKNKEKVLSEIKIENILRG